MLALLLVEMDTSVIHLSDLRPQGGRRFCPDGDQPTDAPHPPSDVSRHATDGLFSWIAMIDGASFISFEVLWRRLALLVVFAQPMSD